MSAMEAALTTAKGRAILFAEMTPSAADEAAFNDWRNDHLTAAVERGVPGVVSAMRYRSPAGPHYLTVVELASPASAPVEHAADDVSRRMLASVSGVTRYVAEEAFCAVRDDGPATALDAPVLWCVFLSVPLEGIDAFTGWFDHDYAPRLLGDPRWLAVRRFDTVDCDPEPYSQIMLHYLSDAAVLDSAARGDAESTDLFRQISARRWFQPHSVVYHAHRRRFLKER